MSASSSATSPSSFFYDLFSPQEPSIPENRDILDHASAYLETSQGTWDLFRGLEYFLCWGQKLASDSGALLLGRISEVVNTTGIGLSIPAIFTDCNNLRRSFSHLTAAQDLPYSDPLRAQKVTQAAKKSTLDALGLTNDVSQAALFAAKVELLSLEAAQANVLDGIYNGTSAILDGAELISEYFKLQMYHLPASQPPSEAAAAKLEEKKTLAWMIIAKDVASIACAVIAGSKILFGVVITPVIATLGMTLTTVWFGMKIGSHFYKQIVVDAPLVSGCR